MLASGANSFLLEQNPFKEGAKQFDRVAFPGRVFIYLRFIKTEDALTSNRNYKFVFALCIKMKKNI